MNTDTSHYVLTHRLELADATHLLRQIVTAHPNYNPKHTANIKRKYQFYHWHKFHSAFLTESDMATAADVADAYMAYLVWQKQFQHLYPTGTPQVIRISDLLAKLPST